MRYYVLDWQRELDAARARVAAFVGALAERLVFVPNATTGIAVALAAVAPTVAAGDELLTSDHAYRACKNQLARLAAARGARVSLFEIPLPFDGDAFIAALTAALTARTRLVLVDHITSPTGIVLPIDRVAAACAARGIALVVDGAHAPGQLAVDIGALLRAGVTWYAANHHKWVCAPKTTGFLAMAADALPTLPLVTSHGASPEYGPPNRLHAEFDWPGTHDPAAHLAVPTAIDEVAQLGGGWPRVVARNHALAVELRARLRDALGGSPDAGLAPDHALGAMAAVPIVLPAGATPLALQERLLVDGWEVPIVDFATARGKLPLVRVSAHLYNDSSQADSLAAKLRTLGVAPGR
jgi:isopenicillin-N epimerase